MLKYVYVQGTTKMFFANSKCNFLYSFYRNTVMLNLTPVPVFLQDLSSPDVITHV